MNASSVMSTAQMNELATIWAIVQSRKAFPSVVVITGATPSDDTESIARGLATAAQSDGQRAGYLCLSASARSKTSSGTYASLSVIPSGSLRESFDVAISSWRSMYDIVIIDAGTSGVETLGLHAMRVGDGVVIAAYEDRKVVSADRRLARVLREIGASVIGVVMTGSAVATKPAAITEGRVALLPAVQTTK